MKQAFDRDVNLLSAARAGALASVAYAVEMWIDLRILPSNFNDFTLLGRPFSSVRARWLPVGALIHGINGTVLGLAFGWVYPLLWGPGWLRGVLFAQVENLTLWPLMLAVDRFHPARREGQLGAGWSRTSFVAGALRHAVYGFVLGALYRPEARKR